jgi:hypothetical protein|tara:strand:+ start:776 stop:1054 length:279 start_codon:yes stop_codon:yes gene_type:complete
MSHELQYPELVTEPEYDWGDSITSTNYNYFFVPSIPEWAYSEFDGLIYEGKEYNWNEVEYRLSVDYNSVPEPAFVGLFMGLCLLTLTLIKRK